jgi:hypothetical protein
MLNYLVGIFEYAQLKWRRLMGAKVDQILENIKRTVR